MAGPNRDPDSVAGVPLGDDEGGNTAQPENPEGPPQDAADYVPSGINVFADPDHQQSAGKPAGSAGLAEAKKAAKKAAAKDDETSGGKQ